MRLVTGFSSLNEHLTSAAKMLEDVTLYTRCGPALVCLDNMDIVFSSLQSMAQSGLCPCHSENPCHAENPVFHYAPTGKPQGTAL